ncbi:hypothetical protein FGO68_gene901 [Halteria grandinella]|uniref:Uncharacterized protein n=1 Tax=Halteria grandinella TaxID=5974 RepID=A0A8J8NLG3_HALGN|nr:hypothetical protein FGO68_gene901 [Halteria grandinella]
MSPPGYCAPVLYIIEVLQSRQITEGATCMELIFRACFVCCMDFAKINRRPGAEDFLGDAPQEGGENKEKEEKQDVEDPFAIDEEKQGLKEADEFDQKWLEGSAIAPQSIHSAVRNFNTSQGRNPAASDGFGHEAEQQDATQEEGAPLGRNSSKNGPGQRK